MGGEPMGGEPMGGEPMGGEPMGGEPMGGEPPPVTGPARDNPKTHFLRFAGVLAGGVVRYPFGGRDVLVHEIRVLQLPSDRPDKYPAKNLIGYFDLTDPDRLWKAIRPMLVLPPAAQPEGIYITVNPVDPDLLAAADHVLKARISGAKDEDVLARNFFYVDADPVRKAKISSTDAEKAAALGVLTAVVADLAARGFPPPMIVDSGNGYHAWFRVNLPRDDGGVVERLLKAVARKHNTPAVKIDTTVFNPSRICKLPPTWARKGSNVPTRPHRMSRVLEVPGA